MGNAAIELHHDSLTLGAAAAQDSCQLRHVLPGAPDASVRVRKARAAGWSALSARYSDAGARAWASIPPDRVCVVSAGEATQGLWVNGLPIAAGSLLFFGEGSPVFVRAESAIELRAGLLPREMLPEAWQSAISRSAWDADAFLVAEVGEDACAVLSEVLAQLLDASPESLESPASEGDGERLRRALRALPAPRAVSLRRRHPSKAARQEQLCRYLRSQAFQLAEWGKAVPDLMKLLCVGRRTLEYEVQELAGLSPYAWLTTMRLDRVRHDLTREGGQSRVGDVAARWGFLHHGRFARAYLNRFGELPRQTAMRSQRSGTRALA